MYRITYEQGNGYSCGCCRRTSTETEDFSTPEEVQNWVNELKADQKLPQYEDDDDRDIESIEKEIGVDIQDQFPPQQEIVDLIIAQRQGKIDEKKRLEKEREIKLREERDLSEYERLKGKFEN